MWSPAARPALSGRWRIGGTSAPGPRYNCDVTFINFLAVHNLRFNFCSQFGTKIVSTFIYKCWLMMLIMTTMIIVMTMMIIMIMMMCRTGAACSAG